MSSNTAWVQASQSSKNWKRKNDMRNLKSWMLAASLFIAFSAWTHEVLGASGAEGEKEHRGQGYIFFAPGGSFDQGSHMGTAHFGGGGDVRIYKGFGIGAELGYLTPWKDFSAGIGIFSANGSYQFLSSSKLSPFVTAGYSAGIREGHMNLMNFGGGINWWMRDGLGLRLEFRDHVHRYSYYSRSGTLHFAEGRIGLSFR
jgi:hypothetical protein